MCFGVPGKVIEIKGGQAKLKLPDHEHWVDTGMIEDGVKVGDYLLTYQNMAINKVAPEEAEKTWTILNQVDPK